MVMSSDQTPPASSSPSSEELQPGLVSYLEAVLERARAGEVQFFVASATITPPHSPTELAVLPFCAIGPRVVRWSPAHRSAAYQTTLQGLQVAVKEVEDGMGPLRSSIVQ